VVLEEDTEVGPVRVHQLEDVGHELSSSWPAGIVSACRRVPRYDQAHELVVDQRHDLILPADVVVQRRLADADRRHDVFHDTLWPGVAERGAGQHRCGCRREVPMVAMALLPAVVAWLRFAVVPLA
jgi:hypothetical protein